MKFISESAENSAVNLVGGKGHQLQKLCSWGAEVAPFFIVTTECFDSYLKTKILPEVVIKRFGDFLEVHPKIALRSSMISEDHADSSFAGLFETYLDVTRENWLTSLEKIFSSLNSPRVSEYIDKKKIKVNLKMAVVVQQLVQVDRSGVLFSRSPVVPTSAIAIDAAYGLGEGVVSGYADVDHYQLTRTKDLIHSTINNQNPVLATSDLFRLVDKAIDLENKAGHPVDIEWGLLEDKLFIFQIRPITRNFEPLTYFVDTNLSESYPGIVSPFTASFVKKAYENVFKESAFILGASGSRLAKLSYHYERLISAVDNHLYYNLEHYYAVLRALPGGERNIENWHKMIGGKIEGLSIPRHETALTPFESVMALLSLLRIAAFKEKRIHPFLKDLEKKKMDIEEKTRTLKDPKETIFYLNKLTHSPLGFGLTIINDVYVMMGLGILSRILRKKKLPEDSVIDLLKTSNGVDSVKPLEYFNNLIRTLTPEFIGELKQANLQAGFEPYDNFLKEMRRKGHTNSAKHLELFLSEYGDRSFEELKLESLPLKNNPVLLIQLIEWARTNENVTNARSEGSQTVSLNWFEKKLLAFTRSAIETREATRLWRGKYYHLIRNLVLQLAQSLKNQDRTWNEFAIQDFFSASPEEWLEFAQGKMSTIEMQELLKERQSWKNKKQMFPELIVWQENEPLPQFSHSEVSDSLTGQGVSQGLVEGVALVLEKPDEALQSDLKDFILVTKNTDPAWVYIMSRSKGLVSEKGSLLSHTAIIGRELNIPTVVGVKQATRIIKTGDRIRLDAINGKVELI